MKRQPTIVCLPEMPLKKKRNNELAFFKNEPYLIRCNYLENCKDIFNALVKFEEATESIAQLIAEYGAEIYFSCQTCQKEKLFEMQLKKCHKCKRGECEFCCLDGISIRGLCGQTRWFCMSCSFIKCIYCQKAIEKRSWRNCCLEGDHSADIDCNSLDDGSMNRCYAHSRKFRSNKKKRFRRTKRNEKHENNENSSNMLCFTD